MKFQYILLPLAMAGLLTGILTGWSRIGWQLPLDRVLAYHGPLMAGSFLGTLIILERIVALKNKMLFLLPLINVFSLPLYIFGFPLAAAICLVAGAAGLMLLFIYLSFKHAFLWNFIMSGGAVCYLLGNILLILTPPPWCSYGMGLMKTPFYVSYPWWMGFFLLTIAGERLELSRFLPVSFNMRLILAGALLLFVTGVFVPAGNAVNYIVASALICSSAWLLKYDMAFHSVKLSGQFRFTGLLLITGYCWLVISSAIMLFPSVNVLMFDALLHSFFIGFVFSMIFAHAPIILPGVLGASVKPYHQILYLWFVLLQISLATRIISDMNIDMICRKWSGLLNGFAILGFFINMMILLRKKRT